MKIRTVFAVHDNADSKHDLFPEIPSQPAIRWQLSLFVNIVPNVTYRLTGYFSCKIRHAAATHRVTSSHPVSDKPGSGYHYVETPNLGVLNPDTRVGISSTNEINVASGSCIMYRSRFAAG